jgi:uncharacterized Zn finger protein
MSYSHWGEYVPVAEKRARAQSEVNKLRKKGKAILPVEIQGRTIAASFWGKGWCDHLESFSDFENRLPRGRTYARNGSVCHLEIMPGRIEALVSGTSLYKVNITVKPLKKAVWASIKKKCSGQIGSVIELLQGKISGQVMSIVADRDSGLFPMPGEIKLDCSCPDWAVMCKHVAATMYGVGNRLDTQPELLFLLRGVDAGELIASHIILPEHGAAGAGEAIAADRLGDIFGIDIDNESDEVEKAAPKTKAKKWPQQIGGAASGVKKKKTPVKKTKKKAPAKPASPEEEVAKKSTKTKPRKKTPAVVNKPAKATSHALRKSQPTGKTVARTRKKLGLAIEEFAAKAEVSPASVRRWESTPGVLNLHARSLHAINVMRQEVEKKN